MKILTQLSTGVRGRFLRKKIDENVWHHVSD